MRDINIAITAASYSGNKGAAAMLESCISDLKKKYGNQLNIKLMSVYPSEDREQIPYDFVKVIPAKPEKVLFIAFPLALLYFIFRPLLKHFHRKNKILKAYSDTDMVIDMAGISFVDSRGFIMNTYAFVTCVIPMLMGVPVVKYSQAMGPFKNPINRLYAKIVLKKCKLICARGQITLDNLNSIGIKSNVRLCADGAFVMPDRKEITATVKEDISKDDFFKNKVVGISLSSVVNKKCTKNNINYINEMVSFIDYLNENNINVFIIANAARINSTKTRNNDLGVCDIVFSLIKNKHMVRWYHKEMQAQEIREYIGYCDHIVASRFHTMIAALVKKKPVLLIGWSHKYKEVLDMFELGSYACDYSGFCFETLKSKYEEFADDTVQSNIKDLIEKNYSNVLESSGQNTILISKEIDKAISLKSTGIKKPINFNNPDFYIGEHLYCRKGYATDYSVRENAASGGMITALLSYMLDNKIIDGAWVTKTSFTDGKLTYSTYIATDSEQLKDASSSIYFHIPLLSELDMLRAFYGKLAVVLTPCMMKGFNRILEKDTELSSKIFLKLGLFCSGTSNEKLMETAFHKAGISTQNAERFYFRRGHWRGISSVIYKDKSEKRFSYTKTICTYKNAYFFEMPGCMICRDQYCTESDISFGDVWLKSMKSEQIKHTQCIVRNEKASEVYTKAVEAGYIADSHLSDSDSLRSQKRALVFKYNIRNSKKWNYKLALFLAEKNFKYSQKHPDKVEKIPLTLMYLYMCFIRFLLSF